MSRCFNDATNHVRHYAEEIDNFLYEDGETSPKKRKPVEHTKEECIEFLESLRESLWEVYTDMEEGRTSL